MPRCYYCGVQTSGVRRWVTVSRSRRIYVSRRGISGGSGGTSTGLRTLCPGCAESMDRQQGIVTAVVLVAIAAFVLFCVFNTPDKPKPPAVQAGNHITEYTVK
jgi:hypothetical protein